MGRGSWEANMAAMFVMHSSPFVYESACVCSAEVLYVHASVFCFVSKVFVKIFATTRPELMGKTKH